MKGGGFNKKNNKPHYDKPQSRAMTPPRVSARMSRRAIPRSK
ncbi:MAG: hypothetical protein WC050_02705 [Candidatus Paceibacterota bacterium]